LQLAADCGEASASNLLLTAVNTNKPMRTLFLIVLFVLLITVYGNQKHDEKIKNTRSRTRIKLMLRSMTEQQTIEVLIHYWNNAGPESRLSLIRTLFNGYPPARLTSSEELMKLNYPDKQITSQTQKFMEIFKSDRTEEEQIYDIEVSLWPNLSDEKQRSVATFLQLSTPERVKMVKFRHALEEGYIWDASAIDIDGEYFIPCDHKKNNLCEDETPSCLLFEKKYVCGKKCLGDANCFSFIDPVEKRSWPGKCITDKGVCQGFAYYDPRQDESKLVPYKGAHHDQSNGWGIQEIGLWSSAPTAFDSFLIRIFSFLLPIALLCWCV